MPLATNTEGGNKAELPSAIRHIAKWCPQPEAADLKHVVDKVLEIEYLDSYLISISISLLGHLLDARAELEKATRPSPTAGDPKINSSPLDVTRIIAFQLYISYTNRQLDPSLRIHDYGTITEESFNNFRSAVVFEQSGAKVFVEPPQSFSDLTR